MNTILRTVLAVSSVAAIAVWVKHRSRPKRAEDVDQFADLYDNGEPTVDVDDDTAAEIIRKARPALERAREYV